MNRLHCCNNAHLSEARHIHWIDVLRMFNTPA